MNTSPTPEIPPAFHLAGAAATSKNPQPPRASPVWRWLFLCSEAALFSLSMVSMFKGPYLHNDDHPILAGITAAVFFMTTIFLLFVSPFFFRRLGWLAVLSWLNALAVAWAASLPVY